MSDTDGTRPPLPDDPEVANGANPGSPAEPQADNAVEQDTVEATEPGGDSE
ncbi:MULTISPECIES: hypothetical protein [unclassified Leifsonia]|uniref:hypothetical protein n=1 Tax=unclassified Leifsonia TaxID=2663824 RepID=UPI000B19F7BA|nr:MULTISPECIES: hypothetical protein [unclassified Leifsonia]